MATKILHDGREVPANSEDWKLECLARHVLGLGSRAAMQAWLQDFEHGPPGRPIKPPRDSTALRARLNSIRAADKDCRKVTQTVTPLPLE